jgi:hypothetical protein
MKIQQLLICSLSVACLSWGCGDDSSNHADDPAVPENTAELCSDTIDNDNNGKTDCDDDSCKVFVICADTPKVCEGAMPEGKKDCVCKDGSWTDCKDADAKTCEGTMPEGKKDCECVDGEWANCQDEVKTCEGNMPEGKKDCECVDGEWTNCQDDVEKVEICDNKTDDDEDGKIDCDDEDCEEHENCAIIVPACEEGTSSCEGKTRNYCEGGVLKMEECPFECVDGSCNRCNDIHGDDT